MVGSAACHVRLVAVMGVMDSTSVVPYPRLLHAAVDRPDPGVVGSVGNCWSRCSAVCNWAIGKSVAGDIVERGCDRDVLVVRVVVGALGRRSTFVTVRVCYLGLVHLFGVVGGVITQSVRSTTTSAVGVIGE